ncbi:MAG: hypothetical protein K1X94_18875 [Sandaracinaceae bacterium]|nr:hypothetical protein [Sandaracinaceae bacterium]
MRARRTVLVAWCVSSCLCCASGVGCALSHERADDAGPTDARVVSADAPPDARVECLPLGDHLVRVRIESEVPAGCTGMPSESEVTVRLPPDFGDLGCGPEAVRVTETGPCSWDVAADCAIPDNSITLHGSISAEGGAVHGRFEETYSRLAGDCSFTIVLGGG